MRERLLPMETPENRGNVPSQVAERISKAVSAAFKLGPKQEDLGLIEVQAAREVMELAGSRAVTDVCLSEAAHGGRVAAAFVVDSTKVPHPIDEHESAALQNLADSFGRDEEGGLTSRPGLDVASVVNHGNERGEDVLIFCAQAATGLLKERFTVIRVRPLTTAVAPSHQLA